MLLFHYSFLWTKVQTHPIFTSNFGTGFSKVFFSATRVFTATMLPTKCKSDQEHADQAAKRGLSAVEDMFAQETRQFEAGLEAEGLPTDLSPLEAAMALVAQEEVRPLHKLSPVRIPLYLSNYFAEIHLLAVLLMISLNFYLVLLIKF